MAPIVTEKHEGRGGSFEAGGNGNEGVQRRYTRVFQVLMDSILDGPLAVVQAEGIPRITDPYVEGDKVDLGARCHSVEPQQEPLHRRVWTVTAAYSTDSDDIGDPDKEVSPTDPEQQPGEQGGAGQGQGGDDPLNQPADISWDSEQYTRPVDEAYNTDAGRTEQVTNSAGDAPTPPLEKDDNRPTLTITRNQRTFDPYLPIAYQDTVNEDSFFGFDPGQAKCQRISARTVHEKSKSFWSVTYVFAFRRDGWNVSFRDEGYFQVSGGERLQIFTDDDVPIPVSQPWPLNGAGGKLGAAAVAASSFFYRRYRIYDRKSFSALNLP